MSTLYIVDTPQALYYSTSKLEATYKHVEFSYKDKARYKEVQQSKYVLPDKKLCINLDK